MKHYTHIRFFPNNIFDTQIAFNFLSEKSNVAYSALVKNVCDIDIKEGSWRTDWLKRPLSVEKIQYAADDVRYLIRIKNILEEKLKSIGRYPWFVEEQNSELKMSNIIINPEDAWEKINYPLYFNNDNLSLLKSVATWREKLSIKYDIPKRWILSDALLIKLLITPENKSVEIIENIKQKITEDEKKELYNIISLRKKI